MTRHDIVAALLRFDRPLEDLRAPLGALDWDAEPVATLTRAQIAAVLRRFRAGEIDAPTVEQWANLVECREDVEFEPRHAEIIADALFDLANPDLQGPVRDLASGLIEDLEG